eukprot:c9447_g1_i1.p1 GENE.c9447_g1_i1~~c9447_g1_i1.p1  ORF type:complete len:219 (-),score=65.89 c9447_g1_i1:30-686(-)
MGNILLISIILFNIFQFINTFNQQNQIKYPELKLTEEMKKELENNGFESFLFVPDPNYDTIEIISSESDSVSNMHFHNLSSEVYNFKQKEIISNSSEISLLETETTTGWWWWWIGWVIQCKGFYYYWWHLYWWRAPWGRWYRFWILHRGFHWWDCHQCVLSKKCVWCNRHCRVDAKQRACALCLVYIDGQNIWREEEGNQCPWTCPRQKKEPFEKLLD